MKAVWTLALLTFGVVAPGCKRDSEIPKQDTGAYKQESAAPNRDGATPTRAIAKDRLVGAPHAQENLTPGKASLDISWDTPATWQSVPVNSPMRKANYRILRTAGDSEDAELAVFHFGTGQGGSIDANVDRWLKQFSDVKADSIRREQRTANGLRQHIVKVAKAHYGAGMPGGPKEQKPDWGLLGGIVETDAGPYFFKLTGPTATVKAAEKDFYRLLDSVKSKSMAPRDSGPPQ